MVTVLSHAQLMVAGIIKTSISSMQFITLELSRKVIPLRQKSLCQSAHTSTCQVNDTLHVFSVRLTCTMCLLLNSGTLPAFTGTECLSFSWHSGLSSGRTKNGSEKRKQTKVWRKPAAMKVTAASAPVLFCWPWNVNAIKNLHGKCCYYPHPP